ncbi:MAG: hypothetical protein FGM16_05195 [Flavobacterium sp.]|nr:hypothetical protein [Flavobacterium sp.]
MHFKQPEILYFLFALILPILVHLFQLRRFKVAYFTNVRFLTDISTQTRKSAKLKKWLLLLTRLLLLACLILAFAQPYFSSDVQKSSTHETYIILDNSYSMQAKGKQGELLKRSVEELLAQLPENQTFSLLTATETYWNVTTKSIKKELQQLAYSPIPFELDRALAQVNARPSREKKDILIITDGLGQQSKALNKTAREQRVVFVVPVAESQKNVRIDSVFVKEQSGAFYEIEVRLSQVGHESVAVPLAIYNGNTAVAKTIVTLKKTTKSTVFSIPKQPFHGYVTITDNALTYDNTLYFSISKPKYIRVLSIGEANKSTFLQRIYTSNEFQYKNEEYNQLDYNDIDKQDVVVLNELQTIPQALQTSLKSFANAGGTLVVIPSEKANSQSNFDVFINQFGTFKVNGLQNTPELITQIAFGHPLYKPAFEKTISNFDYPKVNIHYSIQSAYPKLLGFVTQNPFLLQAPSKNGSVYVFSAAINTTNSNFQQSPLIVPTFYGMAVLQQKSAQTNYTIGQADQVMLDAVIEKDAVVNIKNNTNQFIPIQQVVGRKIKLNCADYPATAGNYELFAANQKIDAISFNYNRIESNSAVSKLDLDQYKQASSIESVVDSWKSNTNDSELWKWFVLLALLFVLLEVFIQKFVS